jgi:hypothetical protein
LPRISHISAPDKDAYDACVVAAPNAVVYGLSWWLDIVSPGWEVLAWVGAEGYRAVWPVPVRRKYGIRYVQQPLFGQFLGIFAAEFLPTDVHEAFAEAFLRRYRLVVRLALRPARISWPAGTSRTLETLVLPLDRPYDQLVVRYTTDRRQNLRRAERAGWTRRTGTEIGMLGTWFRAHHASRIAGGTDPAAYDLLERLFAACQARGLSTLWYAEHDGQPEAGAWFVTWGGRVLYLFNAATEAGRRGNARTWLLDRFLREHAGSGLVFDFESPEVPSIAAFYRSFGAEPDYFTEVAYNHLPGWVRLGWMLKKWLSGAGT